MIDKLEMFIALARERHFGRAAESLGITQPSLSAGIKQLESQLGVQLVHRGSRFGGLTPEGQRVLDWARQIVGDVRTMKQEMRAAHVGLSGNIRLAVIPTALPLVSSLTEAFNRTHPDVRFTIYSQSSVAILEAMEGLQIDGGITYLDNEPLGRMTSVPLYHEDYALVCHRESAEAAAAQIDWPDLGSVNLCLSDAGHAEPPDYQSDARKLWGNSCPDCREQFDRCFGRACGNRKMGNDSAPSDGRLSDRRPPSGYAAFGSFQSGKPCRPHFT